MDKARTPDEARTLPPPQPHQPKDRVPGLSAKQSAVSRFLVKKVFDGPDAEKTTWRRGAGACQSSVEGIASRFHELNRVTARYAAESPLECGPLHSEVGRSDGATPAAGPLERGSKTGARDPERSNPERLPLQQRP